MFAIYNVKDFFLEGAENNPHQTPCFSLAEAKRRVRVIVEAWIEDAILAGYDPEKFSSCNNWEDAFNELCKGDEGCKGIAEIEICIIKN